MIWEPIREDMIRRDWFDSNNSADIAKVGEETTSRVELVSRWRDAIHRILQ